MTKVIVNLIVLLAAISIFVLLTRIVFENSEMPAWLPFDYHDGPWLHALLKLFGVVLLAPPAFSLLASLFDIGANQSRWSLWSGPDGHMLSGTDGHTWVLQLSSGMKWTMVFASAGLGCVIIFLLWFQNSPIGIWLFASPLFLLSIYSGLVFSIIKVPFDQKQITAMTPLLKWRTHQWSDLVGIELVRDWMELRLHFSDGKFARVSLYFNGIHDFTEFAKSKLAENGVHDAEGVQQRR